MARLHTPSFARTAALGAGLALLAACAPAHAEGFDPFVGALMPMAGKGGSVCPRDWAEAAGQILPIASFSTLYSLLGTAYGGDGKTTFRLPDLRGRAAVGLGQGPGLSELSQGEAGGSAWTTLTQSHLPAHSHGGAAPAAATHAAPGNGRALAQAQNAGIYAGSGTPVTLAQSSSAGQNTPVPTMSPYVTITWCIALYGIFPLRP